MKIQITCSLVFVFVIILAGIHFNTANGQVEENKLKQLKLSFEGIQYDLAYSSANVEIRDVDVGQSVMLMKIDAKDSDFLEIAIPYELVRAFWYELSDERLAWLDVAVDTKSVDYDTTYVGSRVTIGIEIPANAEQIVFSGGSLMSDNPAITVDAQKQWYDSESQITIAGKLWDVMDPAEVPIQVSAINSFGDEIWAGTTMTNQTGEFEISFQLPLNATGGSYEIKAELKHHAIYQDTTGYGYFYVNKPGPYLITTEGKSGLFYISSNSTSYEPFLFKKQKILGLLVTGSTGTMGSAELVIPHDVLAGDFTALQTGSNAEVDGNSTFSMVRLQHAHGSQAVAVGIMGTAAIPEFPSFFILIVGVAITLVLTTTIGKRKVQNRI